MFIHARKISIFLIFAMVLCVSINSYASSFTNHSSTNQNYHRPSAVSWIEQYTETPIDPNPEDPEDNPYNYSWYGWDGGDCTNFVSQVLRAGGMNFTQSSTSPDFRHWYYYNTNWGEGRTSSWTHAHHFRRHWGAVNGAGLKRAYSMQVYTATEIINNPSVWDSIAMSIKPGDIVQYVYKSNGQTYHSQVVHSKYYQGGQMNVSVGQHSTGPRLNNNSNGYRNLKSYISPLQGTRFVIIIRVKAGW